nr:NADH-quinone oxidoreductase subunit N [Chloroflexota bacterium]
RALGPALLMTLFMLSLTGIPPFAGFFAKFYVIQAAIQAGGVVTVLAVVAMLNAAAAAFYYLRVVVFMFMRDAPPNAPPVVAGSMMRLGLGLTAIGTIFLGAIPPVIDMTQRAAATLL